MDNEVLKDLVPAIAKMYHFRPAIVERDYYLTKTLNNINSYLSNKLIFKGGTLLNKIHLNYPRLSEDLDFSLLSDFKLDSRSKRSKAISPIREKMVEFLKKLDLKSDNPSGCGFNNSTHYVFNILYPSFITGKRETIRIEVSLRQIPLDKPVKLMVRHFFKDPFTGRELLPSNHVICYSLKELVSEKLKAAITRRDFAIRDYYDLWNIAKTKFDFKDKDFIKLFNKKLKTEKYRGDYKRNFGLSEETITLLNRQIETDLLPVIRIGESFNLEQVFKKFNKILKDI